MFIVTYKSVKVWGKGYSMHLEKNRVYIINTQL